ncbi:tyrosyl-DNA phosphodiesterase 2 [Anaeramoeba flamelloides]|uniref:Tyrosyl-DNA phosphodiesterase 2 n=1 Tax=Anaeramoeba flamelloides TaxID=1746091 RepID=A0ABQ8YWS1_9EUKA|nr:tyrosyl-DNA phosphodiesterase 2 [Anaeramoeba flamelloides]
MKPLNFTLCTTNFLYETYYLRYLHKTIPYYKLNERLNSIANCKQLEGDIIVCQEFGYRTGRLNTEGECRIGKTLKPKSEVLKENHVELFEEIINKKFPSEKYESCRDNKNKSAGLCVFYNKNLFTFEEQTFLRWKPRSKKLKSTISPIHVGSKKIQTVILKAKNDVRLGIINIHAPRYNYEESKDQSTCKFIFSQINEVLANYEQKKPNFWMMAGDFNFNIHGEYLQRYQHLREIFPIKNWVDQYQQFGNDCIDWTAIEKIQPFSIDYIFWSNRKQLKAKTINKFPKNFNKLIRIDRNEEKNETQNEKGKESENEKEKEQEQEQEKENKKVEDKNQENIDMHYSDHCLLKIDFELEHN